MKKELEKQKELLKEQVVQEIERYYEGISTGLETGTLRIDEIERMLGEKQAKLKELVTEAMGEALAETEAGDRKKNALHPIKLKKKASNESKYGEVRR